MFSILKLRLLGVTTKAWCHVCTVTTQPNLKPLNSKISSLMRNGYVAEAQKVFTEMPQRNTVTWNSMISGFFHNGNFGKALQLYDEMPEHDIFSFNTMISGLMKFGDLDGAKKVFDHMMYRDVVTWNSMITGYIQNGFMAEAVEIFDMMPSKDVISWNLVISGYIDMQEIGLAEKLFGEMSERDVVSWTIMMYGFASAGRIVEAWNCFDDMPIKDIQAWNTIIAGYIKAGNIHIAQVLFHKMPERDWNSWNEMINGLLTNQLINDAMSLFQEMPQKCQRVWNSIVLAVTRNGLINECHAVIEKSPYQDIVSHTNLIIGYFNRGEVVNAVKLFNLMTTLDTTVFNVMIFGLGENDHSEDGMKLFIRMKKGNLPLDEATYTSVLTICSNLASLELGKQTHAQVIKSGINCFIPVSNAMLTMYAKCGDLDFALLEFFSMSNHDIISWNSIICGLAYHGHGEKALQMFKQMMLTNVKPNQITFVGVLSACSHTGLIEEGKKYFDIMRYEHIIRPTSEHYTCFIDLLSRFGFIHEAIDIMSKMISDGIEVPASVWGALFGACKLHKEYAVGKVVGERMLDLEPSNTGAYMILTEMHLQSGNRKEAANVLVRMKEKGIKKQPGCSWIEVNSSGHVFVAGESSHPDFRSICFLLDLMHTEMYIVCSFKTGASLFPIS